MSRRSISFALACALAAMSTERAAIAKSCIGHAYEHMEVELVAVRHDGKIVPKPPALLPLDQALNSGAAGKGILFWRHEDMGFAKFYQLERTDAPTPKVRAYLEAAATKRLKTSCGYDVAYTPILPGRYAFSEEHGDGAKTPKGIESPVLVVAPGRAELTLEFGVAGVRYEASYRVKCAHFTWEASDETQCAPMEATPARLGAPSVAPADTTRVTIPTPSASASAAPVVIETHDASPSKRSSCGACAIGSDTAPSPAPFALGTALAMVLALRRSGTLRREDRDLRERGPAPR